MVFPAPDGPIIADNFPLSKLPLILFKMVFDPAKKKILSLPLVNLAFQHEKDK